MKISKIVYVTTHHQNEWLSVIHSNALNDKIKELSTLYDIIDTSDDILYNNNNPTAIITKLSCVNKKRK